MYFNSLGKKGLGTGQRSYSLEMAKTSDSQTVDIESEVDEVLSNGAIIHPSERDSVFTELDLVLTYCISLIYEMTRRHPRPGTHSTGEPRLTCTSIQLIYRKIFC